MPVTRNHQHIDGEEDQQVLVMELRVPCGNASNKPASNTRPDGVIYASFAGMLFTHPHAHDAGGAHDQHQHHQYQAADCRHGATQVNGDERCETGHR